MAYNKKLVVILGGGPAGLTAALEILRKTDFKVIILEKEKCAGGLARSYPINEGIIDLGGHRFHSRSERIHQFWKSIDFDNSLFSVRKRKSLLKFRDTYFDFPIRVDLTNLKKIGFKKSISLSRDYFLRPRQKTGTMRDFYLSNYGEGLTSLFFDQYTQRVWGRHPNQIHMDWGPERLAPLSFKKREGTFLYPKGGPGAFWDRVVNEIHARGGIIKYESTVEKIFIENDEVQSVLVDGVEYPLSFIISSLALDLLSQLINGPSIDLPKRSIVSVNLVLSRKAIRYPDGECPQWIYLHGSEMKASRAQFYRAWEPALVYSDEHEIIGVEYFCNRNDDDWCLSDSDWVETARKDLMASGLMKDSKIISGHVFKAPDAYPCAWEDKEQLSKVKDHLFKVSNLYSIGRHGQHRYMNMDYAMLTGLKAVDNICSGHDQKNLWSDFAEMHVPE